MLMLTKGEFLKRIQVIDKYNLTSLLSFQVSFDFDKSCGRSLRNVQPTFSAKNSSRSIWGNKQV